MEKNILKPTNGNESLHQDSNDNGFGIINCATSKNMVVKSPGVNSASKNEFQDIPGGKGGRCVRVTTLPPSCAECLVIWSLNRKEPSGPHRPVKGVAFCRFRQNESSPSVTVEKSDIMVLSKGIYNSVGNAALTFSHKIYL